MTTTVKPVVKLQDWQYHVTQEQWPNRSHVLTGCAYGHPSPMISTGEPITTSTVIGKRGERIETMNTVYDLGVWSGEGVTKDELLGMLEEVGA